MTCPTPSKMSFVDKKAAKDFMHNHGKKISNRDKMDIYHCPCGEWHLTTMARAVYEKRKKYMNRPELKHETQFKQLLKRK